MDIYRELEFETKEYDKLTKEQTKIKDGIQNYEQKKTETLVVKSELELLNDDEVVYKLIGPTLIQQDTGDAKVQVDARLDMINKELSKLERNYKENETKMLNSRKRIQEINNKFIQMAKQKQQK